MASEAEFAVLNEDEFTRFYLVPLYRAKGYQDVEYYHGGQTEKGKDITMWRFDAEQIRENHAVVVKAGDITGSASGSSSANAVQFQVQQCFKVPFVDKKTAVAQDTHKCFIVASGEIKNNARTTIKETLDSSFARYIRFFDGAEILSQFREFCPEKSAVEDFLKTSVALKDQLKGVDVTAHVIAGVRRLLFRHVDGVADSVKWILELNLDLDAINAEMNSKLKAFGEEGGNIVLPKGIFNITRLPEVLGLVGVHQEQFGDLELRQLPKELGNFTLQLIDEEGERVFSLRSQLWIVSSGRIRMRLENRSDASAFKIVIEADREAQTTMMTFTVSLLGHNAYSAYRSIQFLDALSRAGRFTLINDDTGVALVEGPTETSLSKVSQLDLRLFEKLSEVQRKTGQQIVIKREIQASDIPDIESAFVAVTEGKLYFEEDAIVLNAKPDFKFDSNVEWGPLVIELLGSDRELTLLDHKVDLGETEIVVTEPQPKVEQEGKILKLFPSPGKPFYLNFVKYSGKSEKPASPVENP
jgi:hypothetical protein